MRREILITILLLAFVAVVIQFDVLQSLKNTSIGKKLSYTPNFGVTNEEPPENVVLNDGTEDLDDEDKPPLPITFGNCPIPTYQIGKVSSKPLNLLPLPSEIPIIQEERLFLASDFKIVTTIDNDVLTNSTNKYTDLLWCHYEDSCVYDSDADLLHELRIIVETTGDYGVPSGDNESYELDISVQGGVLRSKSIWGIIRGLETFRQLFFSTSTCPYVDQSPIQIKDSPRFKHRALMLDLARNYYTMGFLKNVIQLMGMLKFNVLQLHLTDDVGLAVESKRIPGLAIGSTYLNGSMLVYSHEDIKEIIAHAGLFGIRVIPEVNMPGHSAGWIKAGIVSKCPTHACFAAWSLALDVTQNKTYEVLENYLQEIAELFPDPMMHLGGDEVTHTCWNEDQSVQAWLAARNKHTDYLIQYFEQNLVKIVSKLNKNIIRWEESFGRNSFDAITYQMWLSKDWINDFIEHGNKVIISHGWYFREIKHWKSVYENDWDNKSPSIIGGAGCIWEISELHFAEYNMYNLIIALGEKLWTPKEKNDIKSAETRIPYLCKQGVEYGFYQEEMCSGYSLRPYQDVEWDAQTQWAYRDIEICVRNGDGICRTHNCVKFDRDMPAMRKMFNEHSWYPAKDKKR